MRKTLQAPRHGKKYLVSDGELVLHIEPDGKWLLVTCPFDPDLITQARSLDEAFAMAYDAKKLLDECRAELAATPRPRRPDGRIGDGKRRQAVG
jgi:predicted RNase H-like HicB family nuclease